MPVVDMYWTLLVDIKQDAVEFKLKMHKTLSTLEEFKIQEEKQMHAYIITICNEKYLIRIEAKRFYRRMVNSEKKGIDIAWALMEEREIT